MDDVIQLKSRVEKKLRFYGLRPTKARLRIGMMLLDKPKHLSADQVYEKLIEKGHSVSKATVYNTCLLYTSPSPRDGLLSRMPSSA